MTVTRDMSDATLRGAVEAVEEGEEGEAVEAIEEGEAVEAIEEGEAPSSRRALAKKRSSWRDGGLAPNAWAPG